MKSSSERESGSYTRAALVCFVCIIACLVLDVKKYIRYGFSLDWDFALSIVLYLILIFLGVRAFRKGRKGK